MELPKQYLYDRLKKLADSDIYPYHMPGHKRNMKGRHLDALYEIDITEIDDFDNLHAPEGILKEAMCRAAYFYGSENTYFLINGSSSGVLSALMACGDGGGKILFARNAHKSAYHALYLGRMDAVYIQPRIVQEYGFAGGVNPADFEKALELEKDIKAVFVTSPTYDGILSDVRGIVKTAHARGIPVIVDEAHGAHFPLFSEYAEESAVACGADLVIQSLHKTLPAPTQTALLHVNGSLVDRERVERYLRIFQTSSPSYVLMSGIDECFRLLSRDGKELAERFCQNRQMFTERLSDLTALHLYGSEKDRLKWQEYGIKNIDAGKALLCAKKMLIDGKELYDILRLKYHLQLEMAAPFYALAMLTVMDDERGFLRLTEAVSEIEKTLGAELTGKMPEKEEKITIYPKLESRMPIFSAQNSEREWVPLHEAVGRVAADMINLYPPGVPLAVPGEALTGELAACLQICLQKELKVEGIQTIDGKAGLWTVMA